jgi:iron complex transport system permease protein
VLRGRDGAAARAPARDGTGAQAPEDGSGAQAPAQDGSGGQTPAPAADGTGPGTRRWPARRSRATRAALVAVAALAVAVVAGVSTGPASLSLPAVGRALLAGLPWHPHLGVPAVDVVILWQVRLPRVVLGGLVGAMLAGSGAAYQGVFRNPLADPYLLGVAAGGGLGATAIIVTGAPPQLLTPAAFAGAVAAVAVTYLLGTGAGSDPAGGRAAGGPGGPAAIVLAGVAVAALLTAIQTYLQQQHSQTLQQVYAWILGGLSLASWSDVLLILPYALVAAGVLVAHRRLLDVLRVGEPEAASLGLDVPRLRLTVVAAATLGTAAAVAVAGLIGFVGIIVPHTIRLTAGASYRTVLPVSMIGGAAFLILADVRSEERRVGKECLLGCRSRWSP